jgi:aminopeptidase N
MKRILLLVFCFAPVVVFSQRKIDVQHYKFVLGLSESDDNISGAGVITVSFLQDATSVEFDLVNEKDGTGMRVMKVAENNRPLTFSHAANKLVIQLDEPVKQGQLRQFDVFYAGVPKDGLIISTNKFKRRTFFGDNWPDRAKNWLPCVDDPADKASVEFIVTAPWRYQVVSNGVQVEETILDNGQKLTHWKEDVALPTKIMVIGVADFAVQYIGDTLGVPVYSWVYPQEKQKAFYDYALAKEVLPFFINNVAPFPYRKLANVQSTTIFGGMENAGCIFYSENIISGQRKSEDLLAHEIAHQWFGDMATETSFAHLWLSEGFATYFTDLYIGQKYGADSMSKRLASERTEVLDFHKRKQPTPVVDSTTRNYMSLLNANSYQKGAWALHMLREHLGADVFMQGVKNYYKKYAGYNASTDDFRRVMEEASGKDLKLFFKQWLYTPGHPVLKVSQSYDAAAKKMTVAITQQQATLFSFPLDVEVGGVKKTLQVSKKEEKFVMEGVSNGDIVVDKGVKLLWERGK